MPEDVRKAYEEARTVATQSPRAAGALLRLAVQLLMTHLGQEGKHLDSDIAALVQNGLPLRVQRALDSLRVIGNESVHPGQLTSDDAETVAALFGLVNVIVEDRITRDREINDIYAKLPDSKRKRIAERDAPPDESS